MTYIQDHKKESECIFCSALVDENDSANLVIHRGPAAFVMLNRYPYTSGHLMIIPNYHTADLPALTIDARSEMMELAARAILVINEVYHPQGYNLGMNLGEVAGAGIAEHLHLHVVPRWGGDTNFMSTTAGTRVLPEALEDTYERIHNVWTNVQPETE